MEEHQRHYIVVVHGIGEQRPNENVTSVVIRFAEQRDEKKADAEDENDYRYVIQSNLSSQSVRAGGAGHGWSEFKGIPVNPTEGEPKERFDGTPSDSGENFRFVDMLWADILRKDQANFAVPVESWAPAVLDRINHKTGIMPKDWVPRWAERMLESVVEAGISVKRILGWKYPELADLIFNDFLGDVHLYGDYTRTRGWAVRHFHTVLDEICLRDFFDWASRRLDSGETYHPPRFTIIAHSLGSIMAFDALTYAFIDEKTVRSRRRAELEFPSLPFSGYTVASDAEKAMWEALRDDWERLIDQDNDEPPAVERRERILEKLKDAYGTVKINEDDPKTPRSFQKPPSHPHCLWRDNVRQFVTLGSPIDKYHVLWAQNYLHLGLPFNESGEKHPFTDMAFDEKLFDEVLFDPSRKDKRIVHYNLCDEQDPVGHHLNVARATRAYGLVFDDESIPVELRDVVFRRYAIPGKAHVDYWEDRDLFKGIVTEVIDERAVDGKDARIHVDPPHKPLPEKRGYFLSKAFNKDEEVIYGKALSWSYAKVPLLAALVTALLLAYGLDGIFDPNPNDTLDLTPSRFTALIGAILLWIRPSFLRGYAQASGKADRKRRHLSRFFARGLLATLIKMAVEWRLIVVNLATSHEAETPKSGGKTPPLKSPPSALITFTAVMAATTALFLLLDLLIQLSDWPLLARFNDPLLIPGVPLSSPLITFITLTILALFGGLWIWHDRRVHRHNKEAAREGIQDPNHQGRRHLSTSGRLVVQMYLKRPLVPAAILVWWVSWDLLCASTPLTGAAAFFAELALFGSVVYLAAIAYAMHIFDHATARLKHEEEA